MPCRWTLPSRGARPWDRAGPRSRGKGGLDPCWSADGRTLYYVRGFNNELWAVDVEFEPAPRLGVPRLVLTGLFHLGGVFCNYAVAADGRFLTIVGTADQEAGREIRFRPRGLLAKLLTSWPERGPCVMF